MVKDKVLKSLAEVLSDYIAEIGYILKTEPHSSNMSIDENGAFITLPEYRIFATAENKEGLTVSLSIVPSKNAIFIEDELVKNLE